MRIKKTGVACFLAVVFTTVAHAENINGIEFVDIASGIGDTDPDANRNGYGAVNYNYKISQHEISFSQFAPSGVGSGNENFWVGSIGSNAPAVRVGWYEAARYANWLTSGDENVGAYTINGSGEVTGVMTRQEILVTGDLYFVLPTENEWYRAAYYQGSGYSLYANGTGSIPSQGVEANYSSSQPWVVSDGALESNNQTYNMMGNVYEWTESLFDGGAISNGAPVTGNIALRGGSYAVDGANLAADSRISFGAGSSSSAVGIRIVAIPEPGTISLMGLSTVGLFVTRTVRRRKHLGKSLFPVRRQRICDEFASAANLAHYEQVEKVESVDLFAVIMAGCVETMGKIRSGYRDMDKAFWNHMVARHERHLVKRQAVRASIKQKSLAALDAFLARIMK